MTRSRRTFLAAAGSALLAGCAGGESGTGTLTTTETTRSGGTTTTAGSTSTEPSSTDEVPSTVAIGFAGDTMVGRSLNDVYGEDDTDPGAIWGDLRPRLQSLDGVCCNLECCISDRGEPFPNRAYYFRGDPAWAVPALEAGNISAVSHANNHALDFGGTALLDTIDHLEDVGIAVGGSGRTPDAARAPTTFDAGGLEVAMVAIANRSKVYEVREDRPGIAFVRTDPANEETQELVGTAMDEARDLDPDLLVVSVHWGPNWVERPSDRLRAFGHWLVDQGADVVHGHSAHVVQGVERYDGGVILHDTGDLVDDFGIKDDLGNDKSYLFEVTLEAGDLDSIRLTPIHIDDGVGQATATEAAWLRETIRRRSDDFETTYERDGDGLRVEL